MNYSIVIIVTYCFNGFHALSVDNLMFSLFGLMPFCRMSLEREKKKMKYMVPVPLHLLVDPLNDSSSLKSSLTILVMPLAGWLGGPTISTIGEQIMPTILLLAHPNLKT